MIANTQSEEILKAAMALSESDRLHLAEELILSVPPPGALREDDPGLFAELDRRVADYRAGKSKAYSWEEVKEHLKERLQEQRSTKS